MNQPDLNFHAHPLTHAGDPASSHHAEARLRKSGRLTPQQSALSVVVALDPGLTSSQIAISVISFPYNTAHLFDPRDHQRLCQVRKRLSDLKTKGRLRSRYTPGESESRWFSAGE